MSVEIDPTELGFHRPFNNEIGQVLKIKNTNAAPVAFKVKTTAPKQYCVRPNSGRIEPGNEVEVSVLLQAMKQEPPPDARCRDKFLVQSFAITGDKEFAGMSTIWESIEKSAIQEKKIRVSWLPPLEGGSSAPEGVTTPVRQSIMNGIEGTPNAPPPAYSSPNEDSTRPATATEPEPAVIDESIIKDEPEPVKSAFTVAASAISNVAASAKDVAETKYETLKDNLAKVDATGAAPKNDATSELRQRKAQAPLSADAAANPNPEQQLAQTIRHGTEGVPIQIVAILCLVSFLLAYFFF